MSKVKQALLAVKIIIAIAAVIIGYVMYQKYEANQQRINAMKECDKIFSQDKWEEAITAYKDFIAKYPSRKNSVSARLSTALQNSANEKSIKALGIPKREAQKRKKAFLEVIQLIEEAKGFDSLTEMSYIVLCDAQIECGQLDKAKKTIAEAEEIGNVKPAKLDLHAKRIKILEQKK